MPQKTLTLYFPKSLSGETLETKYILSAIRFQQDKNGQPYDYPVPLSSVALNNILHQRYKKTLDDAKQNETIISSNHYRKGRARTYIINPALINDEWIYRTYTKQHPVVQRFIEWKTKSEYEKMADLQQQPEYFKVVGDLPRFGFDDGFDVGNITWADVAKFKKGSGGYKVHTATAKNRMVSAGMFVEKMRNEEFYYTKDDFGRLHHNLTSLHTELLPYLRLNGEDGVFQLDIVNSQPLMLCILLSGKFSPLFSSICPSPLLSSFMIRDEKIRIDNKDQTKLTEIVTDGRLYEEIANHAHIGRQEAKIEFFHYAYGWKVNNGAATFFQNELPSVDRAIRQIKIPRYEKLAQLMQLVESSFIFNMVIPQIRSSGDFPISTRHDSILVGKPCVPMVQRAFQDSFGNVGIYGTIKTEALSTTEGTKHNV